MTHTVEIKIYRFDPEKDAKPSTRTYTVEASPGMMLLDALIAIKEGQDPSLTFRRSCREGVCGSDGLNVNGRNMLACVTPLTELGRKISVYPLPGLPVIRDLVVDVTHFFEQYKVAKPWLIPKQPVPEREYLQTVEDREALDGLYECILCGCCSTACPSWWWNGDRFFGPATLLASYRFLSDSRDDATGERLDALDDSFRLFRCHTIGNCVDVCPKGLDPTGAINAIRRMLVSRHL
ncbi:MAG: succinate dehydrogenase iron-sulfur subunit [Alphaproteobacteria bacterium CG_4_10_14_0_2_um_filter_63_37]|nr:MAG: succinate dehydrogenase iron-sulfur subunit [Proteobacteria bacterium CG1_02_64_396]PJA24340.1 MAG: succinate dehydrogenase iron-sulfur subunit [Alphaproteobacteria bacterium CG_4_10_14_0_2_um_filter_63_37]